LRRGCAAAAAAAAWLLTSLLLLLQAREDFDVRVMQLTKQRREGAMKAKTGRGGETRYEARLNSKKHRSTSRRRMKQDVRSFAVRLTPEGKDLVHRMRPAAERMDDAFTKDAPNNI
jgi:hypothetical protein